MNDEPLLKELLDLARSLDDAAEARLLIELFEIASRARFAPPKADDYTPFVYPH